MRRRRRRRREEEEPICGGRETVWQTLLVF